MSFVLTQNNVLFYFLQKPHNDALSVIFEVITFFVRNTFFLNFFLKGIQLFSSKYVPKGWAKMTYAVGHRVKTHLVSVLIGPKAPFKTDLLS